MAKIHYGIRVSDGKIITANEVPVELNGKRCGCICPECKKPLQANALNQSVAKVIPYFRHDTNNSECSAAKANETGLHKLAKQILVEVKRVAIPEKCVGIHDGFNSINHYLKNEIFMQMHDHPPFVCETLQKEMILQCDTIDLERAEDNFRPDATVTSQGKTYYIEFFVSHKIDDAKLKKVQNKENFPMLEIDLHSFLDTDPDIEELKNFIVSKFDDRTWRFYPGEAELLAQFKKAYDKELSIYELNQKRQEEKRRKRDAAGQRRRELEQSEEYGRVIDNLEKSGISGDLLEEIMFFKKEGEIPFFTRIPISGEYIFDCNRALWQSAIFDKFIYNRKEDSKVEIHKICSWIYKHQKLFRINYDYYSAHSDVERVVKKYISYLEKIGFIKRVKSYNQLEYDIVARHTLIAPKKEEASVLESIVRLVDSKSAYVDNRIESYLIMYRREQEERLKQLEWEKERRNHAAKIRRQVEERRKQEEETRKKREEQKRKDEECQRNMLSADYFQNEEDVIDMYGRRWYMCKECKKPHLSENMAWHGGSWDGTRNQGCCKECDRKNK